jgi:signal transduction histidine kinase
LLDQGEPADRVDHGAVEARGDPHGGVGLGLYIVEQIARAHGGTVHVTSSADAGTSFEVRLPTR